MELRRREGAPKGNRREACAASKEFDPVFGTSWSPSHRGIRQVITTQQFKSTIAIIKIPSTGGPLDFQAFDDSYLRRLRDGDPGVESHFASYFAELIYLKLRRQVRYRQLLEDIRQETLCRVLKAVRQDGVDDARKFGAYVNGVCHYVTAELSRKESRYGPAEDAPDPPDNGRNLDEPLIDEQRRREVEKVLDQLDSRDRKLLRAVFFDELKPAEVCRQFRVQPDYLRVLIFRAKARFRQAYARSAGAGS